MNRRSVLAAIFSRSIMSCSIIFCSIAFCSITALAQGGYYAVTNNDPPSSANSASIFKVQNQGLTLIENLPTGGNGGGGGYFALTRVVVAENNGQKCLFVGDASTSDVAAFALPSLTKAGNYTDPQGNSNAFFASLGLAARGNLLFAAYGVSINVGVFKIGTGCKLTLLGTYNTAEAVAGMKVTPDGKTLVLGYGDSVDTYSISSQGVLTENGPYPGFNAPSGVDVTSDSKYAVFGDATGGTTQIEIYPINADGTLGTETNFGGDGSLGQGQDSSFVYLSPNQKFLYVSNNLSKQITSLTFSESPLKLSYVGISTLNGALNLTSIGGLVTAVPSGDGAGLYVAEFSGSLGEVGLLKINANGSTTEAPGSPFTNGVSSSLLSVAAYPPRSF